MAFLWHKYRGQILCDASVSDAKQCLLNGVKLNGCTPCTVTFESENSNCFTLKPKPQNFLARNAFAPVVQLEFQQLEGGCRIQMVFSLAKAVVWFLNCYCSVLLAANVYILVLLICGAAGVLPGLAVTAEMLLFAVLLAKVSYFWSTKRMFWELSSLFPPGVIRARSKVSL